MSRTFTIIEASFHMGAEKVSVGKGPRAFIEAGADQVLSHRGIPAQVVHTRRMGKPGTDIDEVVDLNRQIRHFVRDAIEQDTIPVVLAGNCNTCLGTLGAFEDASRMGIVWLDAHGDFNTPETSVSGMLEGMSLATALGRCHEDLRERIGFSSVVHDSNVLLMGVRDLDRMEEEQLAQSGVAVRPYDRMDDIAGLVEELRARVDSVYLHIDIDFLDRGMSPGVNCMKPGGLPLEKALAVVGFLMRSLPVVAVNLTNYNPDMDRDGLTCAAGLRLLEALVG